MSQITTAQLEAIVNRINHIAKTPMRPYLDGKSQGGNYHLDSAYGGLSLCQMDKDSSGTRDVFRCGHITKRKLADLMHAFIAGLESR